MTEPQIVRVGPAPLIGAALCVTGGSADLDALSVLMGLSPTRTSRDKPIRLGPDAGKQQWVYEIPKREHTDVDQVVSQLLSLFDAKVPAIAVELRRAGAEVAVVVGVEVRSFERPYVGLEPSTIQALAELGAEFSVDWFDPCDYIGESQ